MSKDKQELLKKADNTMSKSSNGGHNVSNQGVKTEQTNNNSSRNKTTLVLLGLAIVVGLVRYKLSSIVIVDDADKTTTISNENVDETLKSMLSIESRVAINKNLNVAVGFGSCRDIFVSSKELIFDNFEAPDMLTYHENIRNQQELNQVLAYFFAEGAAAERYIDNRTFFSELAIKANDIVGSRMAIGGNAPVMAKRFILEGVEKVMLGTQYSKISMNDYDEKFAMSGPLVHNDDIHICIEYPAGERWGKYIAPRANRLIIHSDYHNPRLESVDKFIDRLETTKNLDLIVIGGLQMMDNIPIPIKEREEKLKKLDKILARMPAHKPKIHLELASFTEEALLQSINNLVIPHVHSMGMNEQELPTLLKFLSKEGINIKSEAYPRVATTLDQMRQLFQLLQPITKGKLSRIHAHTLAFQAIMTRVNSGWKNTLTSSVKAALTAHRYTCGSHEIDMAKARLIMDESYTTSKQGSRRKIPFNPKHPVNCWQEDILVEGTQVSQTTKQISPKVESIEICVAPVLVCTKVKQTGGAGDNVSAAGLIFQF